MPAKGYRATHCKRGHEFTEDNTLWRNGRNGTPTRGCRQCLLDYTRRRRGSQRSGPSQKLLTEKRLRVQRETGRKACGRCKRRKPFAEFKGHARTLDGYYHWCRACCSERHRELDTPERRAKAATRIRDLNHGLAEGQYAEMLKAQGGGCAICSGQCKSGRSLAVDHDHATGLIRGVLCADCNLSLGMMGDSPDRLRRAATYLEDHASQALSGSPLR